MNIISVRVKQGYMVDRKPCREPCLCRQLGSEFVWIKLTYDLNSALDSTDGGQDPFLESLIMYSCSKSQAHPSFRWISWIMCLVSYLSHSWGNFKFFSLSFLRYFGLIISCIWLCKDELCSKDDFFLCSDIYPIPAIFVILWWEIGAISTFLLYQSYFHGMSQP